MGLRVITGKEYETAPEVSIMFCSTSGWAFGPVIWEYEGIPSDEVAERFIKWLPWDARKYKDNELETLYYKFRNSLSEEDKCSA